MRLECLPIRGAIWARAWRLVLKIARVDPMEAGFSVDSEDGLNGSNYVFY